MNLNDLGTLWGNPIVKLKEYAKKYRIGSTLLYILDIVIMIGVSILLYKQESNLQVYFIVMLIYCFIFSLIFNLYLNADRWSAFKFYRKFKTQPITVKKYKVDEKRLYAVLYCMNYKRLKPDKDYADYIEMIINACNEDWTFSKSLMKYISKYEDEELGNLELYTITKGKKTYFIDYKETGEDIANLEENNNDEKTNTDDTQTEEPNQEVNDENKEEKEN